MHWTVHFLTSKDKSEKTNGVGPPNLFLYIWIWGIEWLLSTSLINRTSFFEAIVFFLTINQHIVLSTINFQINKQACTKASIKNGHATSEEVCYV